MFIIYVSYMIHKCIMYDTFKKMYKPLVYIALELFSKISSLIYVVWHGVVWHGDVKKHEERKQG